MSCNTLIDNRIDLKTTLPTNVGSFWLTAGDDQAVNFVRAFTRLNTQSLAWSFTDYIENLLTPGKPHINSLPYTILLSGVEINTINFDVTNYSSVSHNGFSEYGEIPLRKLNYNNFGAYGLDPYTQRIWQDITGEYWLFNVAPDTGNMGNPFPQEYETNNDIQLVPQPEYSIPAEGKVPTLILSRKGYLVFGLDFRYEEGMLIFSSPIEELFFENIFVVAGYETRKTLLGFPFSVDSEVGNVDKISKFLRQNNSNKNLEDALSQVTGFSYTPEANVVFSTPIPYGTVLTGIDGNLFTVTQSVNFSGETFEGNFVGSPVTVLSGDQPGVIDILSTRTTFSINTFLGPLFLTDRDYLCTVRSNYVEITINESDANTYSNTLRQSYEQTQRYDINGNPVETFSSFLINKYAPDSIVGDAFYANILREYFNFYGKNILLVLFAQSLDSDQKNSVIDFLQTHTLTNGIIIYETLWQ